MKVKYEEMPIPAPRADGMSDILEKCPVGKSFLVTVPEGKSESTIRSNWCVTAYRMRARVTVRKIKGSNPVQFRVWRLE